MTVLIVVIAMIVGYALGRLRPWRWFVDETPASEDISNIRIIPDKDGKPVRVFFPNET